jgi:dynein heavy chain
MGRYATPATVSRAGILYISEGKQWASFVQSWLDRVILNDERRHLFKERFDLILPETLVTVRKDFKHIIQMTEFTFVQTFCFLLEGVISEQVFPACFAEKVVEVPVEERRLIEQYFVFCCVWAFGSAMSVKDNTDYRKLFSSWFKNKWSVPQLAKFPAKGSVFDVFVDPKEAKFEPWTKIVPEIEYDSAIPMDSVTVPTPETTAISFFLDVLVKLRRPAMLVGLTGAGKTQLALGKLKELPDEYMYLPINFNYYTDAIAFQKVLEGVLEKKAGRNYGPPGTKRLVYFVDDLNLPQLDQYGTQTPIALMRTHIDHNSWYDRTKLTLKVINKTQYITCMNPSAGSFAIDPRLQRHFATFAVSFPSQESLMTIFSTFLRGHLGGKNFDVAIQEMRHNIIQVRKTLAAVIPRC